MGKSGATLQDQSLFLGLFAGFILTGTKIAIGGILEVGPPENRRGHSGGETNASHDGDQSQRLEELHVVEKAFGWNGTMIFCALDGDNLEKVKQETEYVLDRTGLYSPLPWHLDIV